MGTKYRKKAGQEEETKSRKTQNDEGLTESN